MITEQITLYTFACQLIVSGATNNSIDVYWKKKKKSLLYSIIGITQFTDEFLFVRTVNQKYLRLTTLSLHSIWIVEQLLNVKLTNVF